MQIGCTWARIKYLLNDSWETFAPIHKNNRNSKGRDSHVTLPCLLYPKIHKIHFRAGQERKGINRITLSSLYIHTHIYVYIPIQTTAACIHKYTTAGHYLNSSPRRLWTPSPSAQVSWLQNPLTDPIKKEGPGWPATSLSRAWCSGLFWGEPEGALSAGLHSLICGCPRKRLSADPRASRGAAAAAPCRPWWPWAPRGTGVRRRASRAGWWTCAAGSGSGRPGSRAGR